MTPKAIAKQLAYGRMAIGVVMLAAPSLSARLWVGSGDAHASVPTRALGARELLLGFLAAHTIDRPEVGARTVRSLALLDGVDAAAMLAERRELPGSAMAVVGMAAGSMAAGLWSSANLSS